jgi:hypothetical protein
MKFSIELKEVETMFTFVANIGGEYLREISGNLVTWYKRVYFSVPEGGTGVDILEIEDPELFCHLEDQFTRLNIG